MSLNVDNGLDEKRHVATKNDSRLVNFLRIEEGDELESLISNGLESGHFTKRRYPVTEVVRSVDKPVLGLFELYSDSFDALTRKYVDDKEKEYENPHEVVNSIESEIDAVKTTFHHRKPRGRNGSEYNIIHSDSGAGQSRDTFPRLLGQTETGESSKRSIDFIHGRMNRGRLLSLASSRFKIIASASHKKKCEWTWTVAFQQDGDLYTLRDSEGSLLEYDGHLSVAGRDEKTHGCVVKLFDYDMSNPSDATNERFKRRLVKNLPYPPYPVQIEDFRFNSKFRYKGVEQVIEDKEFVHSSISGEVQNSEVGKVRVLSVVRRSESQDGKDRILFGSNNDSRLILSMCGQSHYRESVSLTSSKIEYNNIAKDIIIFARLEEVKRINNRDTAVFGNDRDSFVQNGLKENLIEDIYGFVNTNEEFREIGRSDEYKTTDPKNVKPSFPREVKSGETFRVPLSRDIPDGCDVDVSSTDSETSIVVEDITNSNISIKVNTSTSENRKIGVYYTIDGKSCDKISQMVVDSDDKNNDEDKNYKISVEDFGYGLELPDCPELVEDNKNLLNPEDLPEVINKSGVLDNKGQVEVSFGEIETVVDTKDVVGSIIEDIVREVFKTQNILHTERENSQLPSDYILFDEKKQAYPVEVKAFDSDGSPNFDIGTFSGYSESIANNTELLNSVYLIFGYSMEKGGKITIENFWVKNTWDITGKSDKYPLRLQVKQGSIENIRPITWYSENSNYDAFDSKTELVMAIYDTMVQVSEFSESNADKWLKTVCSQDEDLPDDYSSNL